MKRETVSLKYEGFAIGDEVFTIEWAENKVIHGKIMGVDIRNEHQDDYDVYTAEMYYVGYDAEQFDNEENGQDRFGRMHMPGELYESECEALEALFTALQEDVAHQCEDIQQMSQVLSKIKEHYENLKDCCNA